ncbi:HNH endonuclease signature motif containing protein [Arthrobacter sp. ov407]|uniref:HNH endonuclease signature motif containing protein n=1 Tax=Arthrobacter sp. ov407 TaxID=1761748 RepID=UPI00210D3710|nr:HNH endonuclease signature motif containing protein [Arthrobacter sp. ov407]
MTGAADGTARTAVGSAVDSALAMLRSLGPTAHAEADRFGLLEAADFAAQVEDISRAAEYLQLIAAAAVDRTRKQSAGAGPAAAAPAGWLTGWTQESDTGSDPGAGPSCAPAGPVAMAAAADDGYRNATEFLRARLRISAAEARRRLTLGAELLPRTGTAGHTEPPVRAELAAAVASGTVASHTATIIILALDRVRHTSHPEAAATMEHALTMTAIENDADFLARIARRWTEALDQDGAEPSEELLRRIQGAFIRKPRHGLHHVEIFATTDQFEHLVTVMNTATNPRTGPGAVPGPGQGADAGAGADTGAGPHSVAEFSSIGSAGGGMDGRVGLDAVDEIRDGNGLAVGASSSSAAAVSGVVGGDVFAETGAADRLDLRSRPQRLLDGLVGGCKAALATGGLPAAGGLRPQVMATIVYRDLLQRLGGVGAPNGAGPHHEGTGSLTFTGPITASTVRKIACDADIIPVVLGGEGRILDIGRASRVFPPHVRKALTARDQGCAFPQCTIPAPWCEAHHITYWSKGGSTGTDNGTLLCTHHHHLIHKEQWTIQMRAGIPWFIPPPHVDPGRVPRRNSYFRPN